MADIIVMPPTTSTAITNTNMCPSNNETSLLTPFCAVAPHCLVPVAKIQIQITLETIYEEEDGDDEDDGMEKSSETFASSTPLVFPKQAAKATCYFEITGPLVSFGHNFQCA